MKKGLITVIGTIALAIAGNGFAVAPTISDVPDVIIGDAEDNVGQTIDLNFFRLNNALNLMSYITPGTAPASDLFFAFDERTGSGNALDMTAGTGGNPIQELGSTALPWPADHRISNALTGSFNLSIRNIALSPRQSQDPPAGPAFPSPLFGGVPTTISQVAIVDQREVRLFVADNLDNDPGYDDIIVYSKNASEDELSGSNYTSIFTQSAFPTNGTALYNWQYGQFGFPFPNCTTSTGSGSQTYLGIASGGAAGGTAPYSGAFFGRWMQPGIETIAGTGLYNGPIPHIDGNIVYCAKMRLSVEATTNNIKSLAPDIRFGADMTGSTQTLMNLISTPIVAPLGHADETNPQIPALGVAQDFKFYWSPNPEAMAETAHIVDFAGVDWRRWRLFFDIVDGNTGYAAGEDGGTWKISYVEVGYVPRPADIAPQAGSSTNFELTDLTTGARNANGGDFAPSQFTTTGSSVLQNNPSTGKVTLNAAATNPAVITYDRLKTIPWTAGKIVRCTASLSCPSGSRANFNQLRIRHQTAWPLVSQILLVTRNAGLASGSLQPYVPLTTETAYESYVPSFGGPNSWVNDTLTPILQTSDPDNDPRYFILGLDYLGGGSSVVQYTVHSVLYETLDEATALAMP